MTRRSIKTESFLRFSANFQDFFKIPKIRIFKLIASQLFGVSQSSHRSYLLVKSHFGCFLNTQNSSYSECPKNTKNAILRASMIFVMKLNILRMLVNDFVGGASQARFRCSGSPMQKRLIRMSQACLTYHRSTPV